MEDARARVGLGDLRCGRGVSDMKARPEWSFIASSPLGSSQRRRLCARGGVSEGRCQRRISDMKAYETLPPQGLAPVGSLRGQIMRV